MFGNKPQKMLSAVPEMVTSTGEVKKEEEDYTEGWDTGDDDEYAYDQTGPSG